MSNRIDAAVDFTRIQSPPALSHAACCVFGDCRCIVAVEVGKWHLSISCANRDPNWNEIATARYRLIPSDITMAMLLPPLTEYVNLHEHTFHLHEIDE